MRHTIMRILQFFFSASLDGRFSGIGESQAIVVFMDEQITFNGPSRQALRVVGIFRPKISPVQKQNTIITT